MSTSPATGPLTVGIGGFGAIGQKVAAALDSGSIEGLKLVAVSARDADKARANMAGFQTEVPVVSLGELADRADVVVECAPASVFAEVAVPAVERGRIFLPISVGALLRHDELVDRARRTGARIVVPTGALIGLDAVRAAAEGEISEVRLVTRKPPGGLAGAPYLVENNISVEGLNTAKKVFDGSARDGAAGFPANVNVAAALSLAGIGADATKLEIWADPQVTRNTHTITVEADSARFTMTIENVPTEENPKTGKITALSIIATLRRLGAPMTAGT
ncbi:MULTISPECIES: aspartate dehydrogenase [Thalassobaculum]|uniref:L-aspartate dehydrogenase n=1 Tax=Thalassobaculum litoreum DSM 18839 TaxID=1123362 RepID=A0A8G2BLW3_9PROT|nr:MULTISPECIES: aspartate dehydrogenase [Thalassobaculum]SDG46176.1 aspartate dehydrogenase [Thalassobaculum litoreum DSM 18839]